MLNATEACLESKARRIARIITREHGIEVRVEGSKAYFNFDTRSIVLPNLTQDELGAISGVLDGFLDHECGHGIFSDSEVVLNIKLSPGPEYFLFNVVEDSWVDRAMSQRYVGAGQNIAKLNQAMNKSILKTWTSMDPFNRLLFALLGLWSKTSVVSDFKDDPYISKLLLLLREEIEDGYTVCSTQEAYDLSRRILAKIKNLAERCKEQNDSTFSDDKQEEFTTVTTENLNVEACGGSDVNDSKDLGQGEADSKNIEVTDDDAPEKSAGAGEDANTEKAADTGENIDSGKETGDPGVNESCGDLQIDLAGYEQASHLQAWIESSLIQVSDVDVENFINQDLLKVRKSDTKTQPEDYLVFTEEFDTEVEYTGDERCSQSKLYADLKSQVADYVGAMANMLTLALAAETQTRWVGGARKGRRFDRRAVSQWFLGKNEERLWKQREQNEDWDTAVTLLWDCSGSMTSRAVGGKTKSELARLAAIAFHESLCLANIAHEVLGFHTGALEPAELRNRVEQARLAGEDLTRFSRLDEMDQRMVFVPFGSQDGRALCFITGSHANRDGECVLWAAKRLAARPERRKVLIVGSDGLPSGARYEYTEEKYLQVVVRDIITAGIEVFGLGIMDESVKHYYPEWTLIRRASDIPTVVLGVLSQMLLQRGTQNVRFPELRTQKGKGIST